MKRSALSLVLVFLLQTALAQAAPGDGSVTQAAWPDEASHLMRSGTDTVSDILFNLMGNISLFSVGLVNGGNFGVQVGRNIYDNHDPAQTWSVVDQFNITSSIPLYTVSGSGMGADLGFSFGTSQGLHLTDVRQARRSDLAELLKSGKEQANSAQDWYQRLGSASSTDVGSNGNEVISDVKPSDAGGWFPDDPFRHAEYAKFWNLLTFPVRLPLKAGWLSKLDNGEVMSYTASGAIQLGASVGWNLNPTSVLLSVGEGVTLSTYLEGDYTITILKENERYVRVKVQRAYTDGRGVTVGDGDRIGIFKGVLVAGRRLAHLNMSIVPFQFTLSRSQGRAFDVGYRYDLKDPNARAAYERAVLGQFAASEEISASGAEASVQRLFSEDSVTRSRDAGGQLSLWVVLRANDDSSVTISDATITFPDGTHHVLRAVTNNSDGFKTFWGASEQFSYKYSVLVDKDLRQFSLMAEGFIDDARTTASKLYDYIDRVECIVGKHGIFPEVPKLIPGKSAGEMQEAYYGRTSFYYRISLTEEQTRKFIEFPAEQMWPVAERAFGVPSGTWSTPVARAVYSATNDFRSLGKLNWFTEGAPTVDSNLQLLYLGRFIEQWRALAAISDPTVLAHKMAELFSSDLYNYAFMRVLRIALADEKIAYIASGSTGIWGQIWDSEDILVSAESVFDRIDRESGFDQIWNHPAVDPGALLSLVTIEFPNPDRLVLRFHSTIVPEFLYLRIADTQLVLTNKDNALVEGTNELVFNRKDGGNAQKIFDALKPGGTYEMSLAVTRDGINWGPRVDQKFDY